MSSMMMATQMRDFAKNPASQMLIVGDSSMMKTLIKFMTVTDDAEITKLCVETFHALVQNPKCCALIKKRPEVVTNLEGIVSGAHSEAVITQAKDALALITAASDDAPAAAGSSAAEAPAKIPLGDVSASTLNTGYSSRTVRPAGSFGGRGYLYPIVIRVPALANCTEEVRAQVETVLIHTRGVVSVTIEAAAQRARIYTSAKVEEISELLIQSLADNDFANVTVIEAAPRDELMKARKPGYVTLDKTSNKEAIVRYQRPATGKEQQANGGWFSNVTSYFW
jgi:hypothetical protein